MNRRDLRRQASRVVRYQLFLAGIDEAFRLLATVGLGECAPKHRVIPAGDPSKERVISRLDGSESALFFQLSVQSD